MGTQGLVNAWCPFSDKEKIIYRGLAQKIFNSIKSKMPHIDQNQLDWVPIDPEKLKIIYDELIIESGASILFNTSFCAVENGKNKVETIIVSNKQGLKAYQAKVFIDCTGDADIATWAGAEYEKGGKNGELQAASHCFILTNVDEYGYENGPPIHGGNKESPIHKIIKSDKFPLIKDSHINDKLIGPGTVGFNAGHLWEVDNTNPISTSEALIKGRKLAAQFRDALAEYAPEGFANSFLVATGPLIGIRETRRIIGDYILTKADYLNRKTFEDEICRNSYYLDIHDKSSNGYRYDKGESHGIPYRCLTPKKLDNVLVAGRSISTDRAVQGLINL